MIMKKKEALNLIKMQNEDFNVNKIEIPIGKNEFESIIDIEEPINVAKDDENRKETPEEQEQRLREENISQKKPKKKPKETDKERTFRKAKEGNEEYIKKYIDEYIITGNLNNETTRLNKEELKIYKKYRKIRNPNINYEINTVPTYGAVKKYDEKYPQNKT